MFQRRVEYALLTAFTSAPRLVLKNSQETVMLLEVDKSFSLPPNDIKKDQPRRPVARAHVSRKPRGWFFYEWRTRGQA